MPIRRVRTCLLCFAALLAGLVLWPGPAPAEDLPVRLERGDRLLAALPPPADGAASTLHFEIFSGGTSVGWSRVTLRARAGGGEAGYDYAHDLALQMPSQARIRFSARAVLRADFSVVEIRHERKGTNAEGTALDLMESARLEGGKLQLCRVDDGVEQKRTVSPPHGIAVAGLEFLIPRLVAKSPEPFALRELDPADGSVVPVVLSAIAGPDGATRVSTSRDGETVDEFYLVDAAGELIEFGDPNTNLVERKATAERVRELEATLGR